MSDYDNWKTSEPGDALPREDEDGRFHDPPPVHAATCPVGKHREDPGCHYLGSCNCGAEP